MERGIGTKSPALSPDIMVSVPLRITDQISSKNTSVRATEVCYVNSYGDFPPQDKGVGGVGSRKTSQRKHCRFSAKVILQVPIPKQNLHEMKIKTFSKADSLEFPPTPLELSTGYLR